MSAQYIVSKSGRACTNNGQTFSAKRRKRLVGANRLSARLPTPNSDCCEEKMGKLMGHCYNKPPEIPEGKKCPSSKKISGRVFQRNL